MSVFQIIAVLLSLTAIFPFPGGTLIYHLLGWLGLGYER